MLYLPYYHTPNSIISCRDYHFFKPTDPLAYIGDYSYIFQGAFFSSIKKVAMNFSATEPCRAGNGKSTGPGITIIFPTRPKFFVPLFLINHTRRFQQTSKKKKDLTQTPSGS